MPARVRLPTVGAIGRLSIFERFASRYPCWLALAGIPPLTGVSLSIPQLPDHPFGTFESMNTCKVLRCQNQPAAIFVLLEQPLLQAAVCPEHNTRLVNGENWMLDAESGVLMGSDIPPTVVEYTLSSLLTGEQGVMLNLELQTQAGPRSQALWLSTKDADQLGDLLTNRILR
jgi:hypothetical protein